jgi:phage-related protein
VAEVADLFVTLRAVTAPFTRAMAEAKGSGEAFGAKVGGLSGAMATLGKTTLIAGAAFAGISVKMAGDFQASMLRLKTSAGETGDLVNNKLTGNLKLVSQGLLKMAVDTATSTKQLASGMYMVESAGFHGAKGLQVLRAAAEGAKAEGADLGTVTNALTTLIKDFPALAGSPVQAMNQLITTVSHGKTTMQDLAGALHSVLPIAAAAKLSYAEVGGAIATMTSHGVSAELATQHLAFLIRSLQAPSNIAAKEMGRMGLSANDVSQHLGQRGLTGTMDLLVKAITSHMGPAGMVLLNTFNQSKEAAQGATTMLNAMPPSLKALSAQFLSGKITASDWRKSIKDLPVDQKNLATQFASTVNRSRGFTDALKQNRPAAETFAAALKKVSGGAVGLETALQLTGANAKDFNANVHAIGESSQKTGKHVENWGQIQQSFNFKMGQLKEMLQTVAIKLGTVLLPIVMKVIGWFASHTWAVEALAVVIGGVLVMSVVAFTIALWNMNAALLANPITWIVIAVIAAVVLIVGGLIYAWQHFAWFRDSIKAVWTAIKVATVATWDFLKLVVVGTVKGIALFSVAAWNGIKTATVATWNFIKMAVSSTINGLKAFFVAVFDGIKAVVLGVWHGITSATSATWDYIKRIVGPPLAAIGHVFGAVFGLVKTIVVDAWNIIHAVIFGNTQDVKNAISKFGADVGQAWSTLWNAVKSAVTTTWNSIKKVVTDAINVVVTVITTSWNTIKTGTVAAWHWIQSTITSTISGIKNGVRAAWNWIVATTAAAWNGLKAGTAAAWHGVLSAINGTISGIRNAIKTAWTWLGNITTSAWHGMVNAISNTLTGAYKIVAAIPGNILRILRNINTLLYTVGKNIVVGLWNGLASMSSWLANRVWGWIRSVIPGPIRKVLGISSPSKLMHSFGQYTAQGLADGITSQYGTVANAAAGMARIVSDHAGGIVANASFSVSGAGMSAALRARGGGTITLHNETHHHYEFAGSLLTERTMQNKVQQTALRRNRRNPTNGLATLAGH